MSAREPTKVPSAMPAAEPASLVGSVPKEANGTIQTGSQPPADEASMDKLRSLLLGPTEKQLAEVHALLTDPQRQPQLKSPQLELP